jgi:hypothetical protein
MGTTEGGSKPASSTGAVPQLSNTPLMNFHIPGLAPNPANANNPTSTVSQHKTKFHALTFHHSHFTRAADKGDSTLNAIKQAILPTQLAPDQSVKSFYDARPPPSTIYNPAKVQTRTSSRIVTRDSKCLALEREQRRIVRNGLR